MSDLIPDEKFKFINEYLTASGESQGIEVVATFSTQLSNQVLQYLKSVRSDITGKEAVYAFEVAYLLQTNKIVGNCIAGLNNAVNLVIDQEHQNELILEEEANFNAFHTQASDNTAVQVSTNLQPMSIYSIAQDPHIFQPTIDYGTDPEFFRKYYYTLANWISHINKQVDYTKDALTNHNIDIGAYADFLYKNLQADQRECYLSGLRASQRIKILQEYAEFTWGSAKERLFLEVLESAPEDQYALLLEAFREDNFSLLKGLNGDLWNGENYRLFMAVSLMALKNKHTSYTDIPDPELGHYNSTNLPYHIILQKNQHPSLTILNQAHWNNTGSIAFTTKWKFAGEPIQSQQMTFDPFDIVIVQFEDNYQFAGIDGKRIQKGDMVAVPAMFAYWLIEEQDKIETTTTIRVILDMAAIAASVTTVNPSPFLVADASFAIFDLVFALSEDHILSEGTAEQKEMLHNWNQLAIAFGALNGVYLIQKVTTNTLRFTLDRALVRNRIALWRQTDPLRLEEIAELLRKIHQNARSNLFTSGYNTLKQELALLMRETELNRLLAGAEDAALNLRLSENGGQNLVRLTSSENGLENTVDLCYLDPDNLGRMVFSTLQFVENNPALIDKVLILLNKVNYITPEGELALGKTLSVVRTKVGEIRMIIGEISESATFLSRLEKLQLQSLKSEIDHLDVTTKSKFIANFKGVSDDVLSSIDKNPHSFINYWNNSTLQNEIVLNAAILARQYEAMPLLIAGKYNEVAQLYGKTMVPVEYVGQNNMTTSEIVSAQDIANSTEDVTNIAQNMGIPENIIQEVKSHFWVQKHLIELNGNLYIGRFTRYAEDIALWKTAEKDGLVNGYSYFDQMTKSMISVNALDAQAEFKRLIAHEYVESKLMKEGFLYRNYEAVSNNPGPHYFGAHDLTISTNFTKAEYTQLIDNIKPKIIPIAFNNDWGKLDQIIHELILIFK